MLRDFDTIAGSAPFLGYPTPGVLVIYVFHWFFKGKRQNPLCGEMFWPEIVIPLKEIYSVPISAV